MTTLDGEGGEGFCLGRAAQPASRFFCDIREIRWSFPSWSWRLTLAPNFECVASFPPCLFHHPPPLPCRRVSLHRARNASPSCRAAMWTSIPPQRNVEFTIYSQYTRIRLVGAQLACPHKSVTAMEF